MDVTRRTTDDFHLFRDIDRTRAGLGESQRDTAKVEGTLFQHSYELKSRSSELGNLRIKYQIRVFSSANAINLYT